MSCILDVEGWTKPNKNLFPLPQNIRLLLPVLFGREHQKYCIWMEKCFGPALRREGCFERLLNLSNPAVWVLITAPVRSVSHCKIFLFVILLNNYCRSYLYTFVVVITMTGDEDEPCHCHDPSIPLFRMTQLCVGPLQFMLMHILNHLSYMLRTSKSAGWNGGDSSVLATHNLCSFQGRALTWRKLSFECL